MRGFAGGWVCVARRIYSSKKDRRKQGAHRHPWLPVGTTNARSVCLPWRGGRHCINRYSTNMVVIRLARGGAKKRPFYNIVVADSRERRDGRFLERVGFYNPMASGGEQPLRVEVDRVSHWASVGAQLSPTVQRLVQQAKKAA